ncbi:UNVERIFIED_CONTAM: hypothetical protein GTU68_025593 [Idotea baltica]|nr:hypothetical protein [Idotea baltica]
MPGMGDLRFEHSVIFLCSHSAEGAMGLIVNKPAEDVLLSHLLEQLDIKPDQPAKDMTVYFGGPVESARGFVLHSPDYQSNLQSLAVSDEFSMTGTLGHSRKTLHRQRGKTWADLAGLRPVGGPGAQAGRRRFSMEWFG